MDIIIIIIMIIIKKKKSIYACSCEVMYCNLLYYVYFLGTFKAYLLAFTTNDSAKQAMIISNQLIII